MITPVLVALSLVFFTAAAFYRRSWGSAVTLIALPSYLIRFEVFGIPMTLLEAYILTLFAAWLWSWVRAHRGFGSAWRAFRAAVSTSFLRLSLLWLAVGLAAALWSNEPVAGLGLWKAYFLEPVLFGFVMLTELGLEPNRRWFLRALGVGVLIIGAVSALQALQVVPSALPYVGQIPPRFSSVFEYPNAVGLLIAPIVALFVGLLRLRMSRPERMFVWAVLLFGMVGIAAAVSEGAGLGLLIAIAVLALMSKRWKRWLAVGLILFAIVAVVPQTRDYLTTLVTFRDTSGDVRLRLWQGTSDLLKAHPIEGAGLGGFPALYDQFRDAAHVELPLYPHNLVLNAWVELGLAGLVLFLAFVIRFFVVVSRAYRRTTGFDRAVSIGLLLAMTTLLGHGLVDVPYFKNDLAVLFWAVLAYGEYLSFTAGLQYSVRSS